MFKTADEFMKHYEYETRTTANVMNALTDASLSQAKAAGHNTLGDIAWHIASSPAHMAGAVGFDMPEMGWMPPEDMTAEMIAKTYNDMVEMIKMQMAKKKPEDFAKGYRVWEMDWTMASMMSAMISHEIHHRGQMSVLMRQAGLKVPSIYGPNHEETMEMMKKMQAGGM